MADGKMKSESYALLGGINVKASPYINDMAEFRDIVNMNFVTPGALTKRPGSSLYLGATVSGRITGGVEFEKLNGSSYIVVTANTNAYTVNQSNFSAFKTGLLNNSIFDFVPFVDRLFCANGNDFFKFDGSNASNFSLPPGNTSGFGVTALVGGSLATGTYYVAYGYLNDSGFYGPPSVGYTIAISGTTFLSIGYYGMTAPSGYGITAIALYRSLAGSADMFGTTLTPSNTTSVTDPGFAQSLRPAPDYLHFTLAPKHLSIMNNMLFLSGFSSMPSTVFWSELGQPEAIDPEFNAEIRTNDGDRITGHVAYNSALAVTKNKSFHLIRGTDPNELLINEVSDQYGCVSNRAMVVYEDFLWFLDPKGIVQFDGANIGVVSNKIEPLFTRMNLEAAKDNACAIHFRLFNELWFCIPIDGSSTNNCVVVYDYAAKAWTTYTGINASSIWLGRGALSQSTLFFGGYQGQISVIGASFYGDNGQGITCLAKSSFLAKQGQTTEQMYRRLYLNTNVVGVTQAISVNLYSNYGTTAQVSRTMYQSPFQSRIDYGISARSIQAEFTHVSASLPFRIDGFTFESRNQRDV